jgi:hypothetical protein
MATRLRQTQQDERIDTLWQVAELDVTRHLLRSGATQLEKAACWAALADAAQRRADQHGGFALAEGESQSAVAGALGMSRQAVSKRYRHLRSVG